MARGIATISIPAVAREAGVSVPTVYRHFGSKQDLLAAVYPYALKRAGVHEPPFPASLDELKDSVRAYADARRLVRRAHPRSHGQSGLGRSPGAQHARVGWA